MPVTANPTPKTYHPHMLTTRSKKAKHISPIDKPHRLEKTKLTTAERLLLATRHTDITLQLFAATPPAYAKEFISQHQLGKHARYFHRRLQGKSFYAVVYGTYPNHTAAEKAIATLPSNVRQLHPWIRTLASIQQEIRLAISPR